MTQKQSVAAEVVRQARSQTAIIDLDAARLRRTTLVRGVTPETSLPFLKAVFPAPHKSEEVDLTFLLSFPNLSAPFAEGFRRWASRVNFGTRRSAASDLSRGFFGFLTANGLIDAELADLDRGLFVAFVSWLDRPDSLGSGQPFAIGTRRQALGNVRVVLEALVRHPTWGGRARAAKEAIPVRSWPGGHLKATPKQQLDIEHLRLIVRAAEAEVVAIAARFDHGEELVRRGQNTPQSTRVRGDLASFLAILSGRYPTLIPGLTELTAQDSALGQEMQAIHTQRGVTQYFYAGSRDLVPFVILILAATAFNVETVLTLEWRNVRRGTRFDLPVVTLIGTKERADEDQVVLDHDTGGFGIAVVLETLSRITARLRGHLADSRDYDRLFLFAQERATLAPKSFRHSSTGLACSDSALRWARLRFIEDNQLAPFTFDRFRATLLDAAQRSTGDLRAAASLGRHRNPATTWRSYTSADTRSGYRERIGETIVLRERWFQSDGKIDPRTSALTTAMDRGAATPGFRCLDPYDSPQANQKTGRLCSAYGACPSCPLAGADVGDSASVAYYEALRTSIFAAQGRIAPLAWVNRWAPVAADLDQLLSLVAPEVRAAAAKLRVQLPVVG